MYRKIVKCNVFYMHKIFIMEETKNRDADDRCFFNIFRIHKKMGKNIKLGSICIKVIIAMKRYFKC